MSVIEKIFNEKRKKFFLISGPCVIENSEMNFEVATFLKEITTKLGIDFIFKSSLDKANRSSSDSFRGLGYQKGLQILEKIKTELQLNILTDVHEDSPIDEIINVVDVVQTPAFLCRQTNFIQKVASFNKPINIKKGQFLSPYEMNNVVEKARAVGNDKIMVCERGYTFGYNNLVSDMRSLVILKETNCPVVFDATHSTQLPGANKNSSGGERKYIIPLSKAAIAVGIDGIFIETHPNPDKALSDGPNSLALDDMEHLLNKLVQIDDISKK